MVSKLFSLWMITFSAYYPTLFLDVYLKAFKIYLSTVLNKTRPNHNRYTSSSFIQLVSLPPHRLWGTVDTRYSSLAHYPHTHTHTHTHTHLSYIRWGGTRDPPQHHMSLQSHSAHTQPSAVVKRWRNVSCFSWISRVQQLMENVLSERQAHHVVWHMLWISFTLISLYWSVYTFNKAILY